MSRQTLMRRLWIVIATVSVATGGQSDTFCRGQKDAYYVGIGKHGPYRIRVERLQPGASAMIRINGKVLITPEEIAAGVTEKLLKFGGKNRMEIEVLGGSHFGPAIRVTFHRAVPDRYPPKLTVLSPSDGATVRTRDVEVSVTGEDDSGVLRVAIVGGRPDADRLTRRTHVGHNMVTVTGTDPSGNTTSRHLTLYSPPPATRKLPPVDEGGQDPSFVAFRTQMNQAIEAGNWQFVETQTSVPGTVGQLRKLGYRWRQLLGLGAVRDPARSDALVAPYVFAAFPKPLLVHDRFYLVAVTGKFVPLRKAPSNESPIVAKLSYDLVEMLPDFEPVSETVDGERRPWVLVRTFSGRAGYVRESDVWDPCDTAVRFVKRAGQWRIDSLYSPCRGE